MPIPPACERSVGARGRAGRPHVISTEHRNLIRLMQRLGTFETVTWQPEPFITLFDHGKVLPIHYAEPCRRAVEAAGGRVRLGGACRLAEPAPETVGLAGALRRLSAAQKPSDPRATVGRAARRG